mgnify:CR=1 FL=1
MQKDYKPNSFKSKERAEEQPRPRAKKVTIGEVRKGKGSWLRQIVEAWAVRDIDNLGSYIVTSVVIPLIKNVGDEIWNAFWWGGAGGGGRRSSGSSSRQSVSYQGYYDKRNNRDDPPKRRAYEFADLEYDTQGDAIEVLRAMRKYIDDYGFVTAAYIYELIDQTNPNFTLNSYGWNNLDKAEVYRVRGGFYRISFPEVMPIN